MARFEELLLEESQNKEGLKNLTQSDLSDNIKDWRKFIEIYKKSIQ